MTAPHPHPCPLAALLHSAPVARPPRLAREDVERVAARVVELLAAQPAGPAWLTVTEAVAYTGRSRRTLYRAIHAGELLTEQRGRAGARHALRRDALDAWMRG